ncbi:fused MFS/spermidine synthase [Pacificimonas flava]|uniref:fused MFS/spermidine synthase n=1 Tax=Pacificimonas flava TaxID=1234595 RepID=UPI0006842C03|nr:fused MFS/spermidine synthase [Pacificimonas flava]MBB5280885.1 hypothetical protein [Pacificimonas flava]
MTIETGPERPGLPLPGRGLFVLTVFTGSFLLFLVQPMFARIALPALGGAPGVWTVAMLFYQAALLAGYVYAHLLTRRGGKWQPWVHFALFGAAALTLPIGMRDIGGYEAVGPTLWLLALLTVSIGPVFFLVAAQAPLMQSWFAAGERTHGQDPYFLYAASNAGSLAALAAYPLLIEPYFPVDVQRFGWSAGFLLLAALTFFASRGVHPEKRDALAAGAPIPRRRYVYWGALAAIPSGLMLSTTTFLTMDIVAVPLLWVIPLGLYLLSYIVAYAEGGAIFVRQARFIAPLLLLGVGSYAFLADGVLALLFAMAGLILLFYVALALHGELAATRPPPAQLTAYYLTISVGGMIGGLFPAVVAPSAFDWTYEYPILLIGAAALLPATPLLKWLAALWQGPRGRQAAWTLALVLLALSTVALGSSEGTPTWLRVGIGIGAVILIGMRLPFALAFTALLLSMGGWTTVVQSVTTGQRTRSFFGIYTVTTDRDQGVRRLEHGTTLHGLQSLEPGNRRTPLGYYSDTSGAGRVFAAAAADAKIGVVGLGVGSLSCYAKPAQDWTFYEIDPAIVRIARDESRFTYLSSCTPDARIVLGDARLSLARKDKPKYDLLAIDAFSSDAIPQHLMTIEAFQLYGQRLATDGVLMVHISNRFLNLEPVVSAITEELGWQARIMDDRPSEEGPSAGLTTRSIWVAMSPDASRIEALPEAQGWRPLERHNVSAWRDDFGSIVSVLRY